MANLETILNIRVEGTSEMVKLKDQITKTESGLKKLKEAQKQAGKDGQKFTSSIVQAETKLKGLRKELNSNKNDLLKMNAATQQNTKSYNSLTQANAALSAQLRKLADPLGKNKKEFDALSGKMAKNEAQLKKMDKAMGRSQRNVGNYGGAMSGLALKIGGAVAAFKTLERAMAVFVDFEFTIKQVGIISGATAEELKMLSDSAKELGSSTSFTAGEVAGLQKELAKMGFDPTEIIAMTDSVMDLSFAFGDDLAMTAEQTGIVLKAFNMDASKTSHVTDIMAAAFSNTLLDMEKFAVGMPKVASIAQTMGFSFEDTTVLLGALADTGMEASTSATALKNIFLKLANPSGELAETLGRNITSIDQLIPALQELDAKGIDVAEMLEITDKRSVTAFASLLNGADSLEELNKKINDSKGLTKRFAETMRDSLKGSIDETKSAAEGFVLVLFEKLQPALEVILTVFQGLFSTLSFLTPVIVGLGTAFLTYKTVMIATRIATWAFNAAAVASRVATIALTHGVRGLNMSFKALNLTMKANPIGLITSLAAGAIAMFSDYGDEVEEVDEALEELNKKEEQRKIMQDQMNASQAKDIQNLQKLIATIKDTNKGNKERMKAVDKLNAAAGTTITNLSNEKKLAKELAGAYASAVEAIKAKYILQLAEGEVLDLIKEEVELQKEVEKELVSQANIKYRINELEKEKNKFLKQNTTDTRHSMVMTDQEGNVIKQSNEIKQEANDLQYHINGWETDLQESKKKTIEINKKVNDLQVKQNKIMSVAQKTVEGMIVVNKTNLDTGDAKLTQYQKLKNAVEEETAELTRLIIEKQKGNKTDKQVKDQIKLVKQAKIDLMVVDKEVTKIQNELNKELEDSINPLDEKIKKINEQIAADELVLNNMKKLADNGAELSREIIQQSIDIAQAKLDMALITMKASDESTATEVENINKLKEKIAGFQADMAGLDAEQPATGWLNKSLFGSGGEDGEPYTGGDFLNDLTVTLGEVSAVMDEVSALQNQRLDTQLGVIETEKNAEIEAYKKTAAFAVMSTEEQDTALAAIAKKHDDEMLALKVAQFERDKKMDISQAIMKGAMGIMNIWGGNITGNPLADAIIKGILTTAMVATTGLQIATIKSTAPPTAELGGIEGESFATGGMVHGNSHAQGGEKFAVGGRVVELEGGEAVINKRSTAMFKPQLSAMNSAGGGKKFADGGMVFATDMLETQANSMENLILNSEPQEVLLVEADVTNSQRSVANIEAKASF